MNLKLKLVVLPALMILSSLAGAQECIATDSSRPAVASLGWLQGYWTGELRGAALEQYFAPPAAGVGVALFRLVGKDGEQVIEFSTLRDTPDGVELRLRHFDLELKSMEPDDKPTILRVETAGKECALLENPYNGMPRQSILQKNSATEMQGKSEIVRDDKSTATIEVGWKRAGDDVPLVKGKDLEALAGHWLGQFNGGTFEQWWFTPKNGAIVGVMRFYQGTSTRMLELYSLKVEGKVLKSFTWQLGPELVLAADHPKMMAEGAEEKPGMFVFHVHRENFEAKSSLRVIGRDRLQQRVEIAGEKPIVMVIDLKRVSDEIGPPKKITGEKK